MSWDIPVGTEFAGYRIESVLGRGGMSVVYAAEHVRLGRMVALKLLAPALAADDAFRERFFRESRVAATLDHPNIVPIYDAGEADGFFYIAMRHVDGSDLGTLIERDGPLPLGQTLFLVEQIASALDYAHRRELVHRDVKPANVLVGSRPERAYLTDFGVVKQASAPGLTRTGFFLGTFEYAAPEQIEGTGSDGRTDEYALACVVFECLSGEPPYDAPTQGALIHAHLTEPPPRLTAKRPDLPPLDEVIAAGMAKSPDDRYPTCTDFARALRAVVLGTEERATSGPRTLAAAGFTVASPADAAAPAAAPPPRDPPAAAPAAGGRGPRTLALTRGRVAALAAVVAALVAGAVAAALVLADGGGGSAAGGAGAGVRGAAAASSLLDELPRDVPASSCGERAGEHPGALHTVSCDFRDRFDRHILLHVDDFKGPRYLAATYAAHGVADEQAAGGRPDLQMRRSTGACTQTRWLGEGPWSHGGGAEPAGRRSCYLVPGSSKLCRPTGAASCSVIVWTLDVSNLFMRAVLASSQHRNLLTWWNFHAHLFG